MKEHRFKNISTACIVRLARIDHVREIALQLWYWTNPALDGIILFVHIAEIHKDAIVYIFKNFISKRKLKTKLRVAVDIWNKL